MREKCQLEAEGRERPGSSAAGGSGSWAGQGRWTSLNPSEAQGLFAHITSQDITPFLASTCHGKNWYLSILLLMDGGDQLIWI